jgi:predicted metal-binding membrane protein
MRAMANARSIARGPMGLLGSAAQLPMVALAIASAWLLIATAQLTGTAALLHHHALIEHGPPLWIAVPAFLAAWLVMIFAMMVPASLPAIAGAAGLTRSTGRVAALPPGPSVRRFLAPSVLVWTAFGLAMFFGDAMLHRLVDAAPWLGARPSLINASVIGFAGLYQLLPIKRSSLDACRHSAGRDPSAGLDHAMACLASSGALMLLMFAEGFSSPWPMLGLTAVMVYEATGRHGETAARVVGVVLVAAAIGVALTGTPV